MLLLPRMPRMPRILRRPDPPRAETAIMGPFFGDAPGLPEILGILGILAIAAVPAVEPKTKVKHRKKQEEWQWIHPTMMKRANRR